MKPLTPAEKLFSLSDRYDLIHRKDGGSAKALLSGEKTLPRKLMRLEDALEADAKQGRYGTLEYELNYHCKTYDAANGEGAARQFLVYQKSEGNGGAIEDQIDSLKKAISDSKPQAVKPVAVTKPAPVTSSAPPAAVSAPARPTPPKPAATLHGRQRMQAAFAKQPLIAAVIAQQKATGINDTEAQRLAKEAKIEEASKDAAEQQAFEARMTAFNEKNQPAKSHAGYNKACAAFDKDPIVIKLNADRAARAAKLK